MEMSICDRCGREVRAEDVIDGPDGEALCDDCSCAVADEEVTRELNRASLDRKWRRDQ